MGCIEFECTECGKEASHATRPEIAYTWAIVKGPYEWIGPGEPNATLMALLSDKNTAFAGEYDSYGAVRVAFPGISDVVCFHPAQFEEFFKAWFPRDHEPGVMNVKCEAILCDNCFAESGAPEKVIDLATAGAELAADTFAHDEAKTALDEAKDALNESKAKMVRMKRTLAIKKPKRS